MTKCKVMLEKSAYLKKEVKETHSLCVQKKNETLTSDLAISEGGEKKMKGVVLLLLMFGRLSAVPPLRS